MNRRPPRAARLWVLALLLGVGLVASCSSTGGEPPADPAAFFVTTAPESSTPITIPVPEAPLEGQYAAPDPEARNYGDDPTLDELWDECAEGSGAACDDLYWLAPLDSQYEAFAYSCGEREEVVLCSELDEELEFPTTTTTTPRRR